jgi:two-component system, OmpR family, KDP operon response regulator KdpE
VNAGYQVLHVDDTDLNLTLARAVLARCTDPVISSIVLTEVDTLAGAREAVAARSFDLILLDMHLPDGHGLELARELKDRPHRPVIVAVTASVLPQEQQAVLANGCDAFLGKPYSAQQLIDILTSRLPSGAGRHGHGTC